MLKITSSKNTTLLTKSDNNLPITINWFNPDYWQEQNAIVNKKVGRAPTWFFKFESEVGVLRHYWRGGLIGKILNDQYLYTGIKATRPYREFLLLCQLEELDLPVSKPIAAKITRDKYIYRGDLITHAISQSQSVLDLLKQKPITDELWVNIAHTIAQFHNHGVNHADLNINNILIDDTLRVYLIDFDRGTLNTPSQSISKNNIDRLKRSLLKEEKRNSTFFWQEANWQTFINAYRDALEYQY